MKIPVTIYTTPNCVQCNATKREFDKHNIDYEVIDLSQHPELADTFRERGLTQAPIVTTDTKEWSGFRREKILSLANYIKSLKAHEPEEKPEPFMLPKDTDPNRATEYYRMIRLLKSWDVIRDGITGPDYQVIYTQDGAKDISWKTLKGEEE